MEKLKEELSKIGTIEVIKNDYVFTLLMRVSRAGRKVLEVLGLVTEHVIDKSIIEVCKNDDDYILIILKP